MARRAAALIVALAALAATASATDAADAVARPSYAATLSIEVVRQWRLDRTTTHEGCVVRETGSSSERLTLASRRPWLVRARARPGGRTPALGGRIAALAGRLVGTGGSLATRDCDGASVVGDSCLALTGAVPVRSGSVVLTARGGRLRLERLGFPPGPCGPWPLLRSAVAAASVRTPGALGSLRRGSSVVVAGADEATQASADGAESTSVTVRWRLRLRRVA